MSEDKRDENGKGAPKLSSEKQPLLSSFRKSDSVVSNRSVTFGEEDSPPLPRKKPPLRSASSFMRHFTDSERQEALGIPGVGAASFLIRDAVLGTSENPAEGAYDPYDNLSHLYKNLISVWCRRIVSMRLFRYFMKAVVWFLVILSFFEPPSWCFHIDNLLDDDDDVNFETMYSAGHCHLAMALRGPPATADNSTSSEDDVEYYPGSGAILLMRYQAIHLEALCLTIISIFVLMLIGRDGCSVQRYLRPGPARLARVAGLIALVALVGGMILSAVRPGYHPRLLSPFCRIALLIALSKSAQRELRSLFQMIPEVFNILILLFIFIAFYAWFGVVIFYGTEEGKENFPNIIDAMWTLYIMVTTANYPDVMMPVYNKNRASTFYFIIFMMVTFFFMMNVILAAVVNAYDNELGARKVSNEQLTEENLKKAFNLLDSSNTGRIDRDTVMALFLILNEDFPEFRTIPDDDAKLLFAILDKDGSSYISEDEFMDFGNVMLLEFERVDSYMPAVERYFPKFYKTPGYQAFSNAVKSPAFEYGIDIILVLNAIVVAIQSYPLLVGEDAETNPHVTDGEIDTVWEVIETVFTVVYVLEFVVKVLVLGWKRYSESYKNLFDMTVTWLAVFATIYVYYPNEYSDSRLIRYVVMIRVLRLARLLVAVKQFQVIGSIAIDILPVAANVLLLLFCIMYIFATLGVLFFGGWITRDPNNPNSYLLLGTDFADNDYWANNFNDMLSSLNVLFNLLVVNNWNECWAGFEAVAQNRYTRLYFLAFYIWGVVLVNNIVIAFIVSSFIKQWDIFHEQISVEEVEGEALIEGRRALFDASHITGTKTFLSGKYVARLNRHVSADHKEGQQKFLKKLFTKTESQVSQQGSFQSSLRSQGSVRSSLRSRLGSSSRSISLRSSEVAALLDDYGVEE